MDADVRVIDPRSLARLAEFIQQSGAALVSGVPCEETRGLMEKLIIPLIHFVLLGFLAAASHALQRPIPVSPPPAVRSSPCAARPTSGPAGTPRSRIAFTMPSRSPGAFARRAFATDLFDATDTFHCRMYRSARSRSGTASPKMRTRALAPRGSSFPPPCSSLAARCLPLFLLAFAPSPLRAHWRRRPLSAPSRRCRPLPPIASWRAAASRRHLRSRRHPVVRLHPLSGHRPAVWKGRSYSPLHEVGSTP